MMYAAALFAPDGAWVTDYHGCTTVEEVQERLADQGSRWIFYPFHAVIEDHVLTRADARLVDVAEPFEECKGETIGWMTAHLEAMPEEDLAAILEV